MYDIIIYIKDTIDRREGEFSYRTYIKEYVEAVGVGTKRVVDERTLRRRLGEASARITFAFSLVSSLVYRFDASFLHLLEPNS